MNALELRASLGLASIYALRMLGMFLILPVFSLYAQSLPGVKSATWIGIAFGSYGLTQALLQLPLGMLSDRIGRKKVIYLGLALFALGSFVAAGARSIELLILGRIIQGSGAISAALTALLADLTREENRTKAMAMIGVSIGMTFAISLVLGPLLGDWIGVDGIFTLTGVLTCFALLGMKFIIPHPVVSRFHSDVDANSSRLMDILHHHQLLRLNFGIFALHSSLMAVFLIIPFALLTQGHLDKADHWKVYLPVVLISLLLMIPVVMYAETRHRLKRVFISAIVLITLAQLGMSLALTTVWHVTAWLACYLVAFNILEATLPSVISKIAPADAKGTAIGVYNSAQSLGICVGAAAGGKLYTHFGSTGVFIFSVTLMLCWLALASTMQAPAAVKSVLLHIDSNWQGDPLTLSHQLAGIQGVHEAVVIIEEGVAYLKVSQLYWDQAAVKQLMQETY